MVNKIETIRIRMRKRILLKIIIFLFACSTTLPSQTVRYGTISGAIRDTDSEDPIYFVNVFLANTTLGAASDENGYFKIENVTPGNYEIIFSHIGYEAQIIPIDNSINKNIIINISLKRKVLEGEEVTIETKIPREWQENLKRFTRIFIGETDNASKCKILNPEIIDIQVDPETNVITAYSENMIRVENQALGYDIEIILAEFQWITDHTGSYSIYLFFKEMEPTNDKEYQKWLDNRYESYKGSLMHFLSSIAFDQVEENKFYLYKPKPNGFFWKSEYIKPDSIHSTIIDSIHYIKRFTFNGDLIVHYGLNNEFVSSLKMKNQYVDIDSFGYNIIPNSLDVEGYWATLRVAEMLPRNYRPYK